MYTRVRAVLAIISARKMNVLTPMIYCGALVIMLNVRSDNVLAYFPLPGYPERSVMIEVVVLLLLVLYYSVPGAAVATCGDTHGATTCDTSAVPVLHMPNTSSTCRMAWCLCSCAHSCQRMSTISQLHMDRPLMPLYSSSTTTRARCAEQWREKVPGDVLKQCALPWPPGCASERVRVRMDEHSMCGDFIFEHHDRTRGACAAAHTRHLKCPDGG